MYYTYMTKTKVKRKSHKITHSNGIITEGKKTTPKYIYSIGTGGYNIAKYLFPYKKCRKQCLFNYHARRKKSCQVTEKIRKSEYVNEKRMFKNFLDTKQARMQ